MINSTGFVLLTCSVPLTILAPSPPRLIATFLTLVLQLSSFKSAHMPYATKVQ